MVRRPSSSASSTPILLRLSPLMIHPKSLRHCTHSSPGSTESASDHPHRSLVPATVHSWSHFDRKVTISPMPPIQDVSRLTQTSPYPVSRYESGHKRRHGWVLRLTRLRYIRSHKNTFGKVWLTPSSSHLEARHRAPVARHPST